MSKPRLPQLPARVPQFVIDKAEQLRKDVGPLGQPRVHREDIVGALIYVATVAQTVKALEAYNPKLGEALNALEQEAERQAAES